MNPRTLPGRASAAWAPALLSLVAVVGVAVARGPAPAERSSTDASTARELAPALESDFVKEFKKHSDSGNAAEMQKLVKSRTPEAVLAIVEVAEAIAVEPKDDLEKLHASMREAWKAVYKTEFAERVYKYFSTLDAAKKKNLAEIKAQYEKARAEFEGNLEKKDPQGFDFVEAKLRSVPDYFDQEGDLYHASESAYVAARSMDEALHGTSGDLHLAWRYYTKAVEMREKLDLKDAIYDECSRRKSALAAKGFDKKKAPGVPQDPGGGAPSNPAPQASGETVKAPLAFELVATVDAFQRPNFFADDISEIWPGMTLEKKAGNKSTFPTMTGGPVVLRSAPSELRVDGDGDGNGEEKIPLTGNVAAVKCMLGKGADAHPWGFLCVTGSDKASYQGIQVNLAPTDDRLNLYTLAAASVVGTIAGTPVRIIDESMDGVYGSSPQRYGYDGCSKDVYQPVFDSIVIGSSKKALPYSEWIDVGGGKWYRLAVAGDKELVATPGQPSTGFVKLEFKGAAVQPNVLILHGTAELDKSYFDVSEGGAKGVSVPAGKYELFYGELRKGKKKQLEKCLILPGKTPPTWTVRAGETATIELGAPFDFDFHTTKTGEKIKVEGPSIRVVGKAGERYERTWNCVPHPEAAWRKKGTKKASKYEKMVPMMDNELINKNGWGAPWGPLDLELDAKGAGNDVEVQLVDKKHELFGKIESTWKE